MAMGFDAFCQRTAFYRFTLYCYLVRRTMELQIPHKIQFREYSRGCGAGGFSHIRGELERQPEFPVPQQRWQALEWQLELD